MESRGQIQYFREGGLALQGVALSHPNFSVPTTSSACYPSPSPPLPKVHVGLLTWKWKMPT